jgi:hypothetical protein
VVAELEHRAANGAVDVLAEAGGQPGACLDGLRLRLEGDQVSLHVPAMPLEQLRPLRDQLTASEEPRRGGRLPAELGRLLERLGVLVEALPEARLDGTSQLRMDGLGHRALVDGSKDAAIRRRRGQGARSRRSQGDSTPRPPGVGPLRAS